MICRPLLQERPGHFTDNFYLIGLVVLWILYLLKRV